MSAAPAITAFFDEPTNTVSYLLADPATGEAAVIDPVLDYDHRSGKASTVGRSSRLVRMSSSYRAMLPAPLMLPRYLLQLSRLVCHCVVS